MKLILGEMEEKEELVVIVLVAVIMEGVIERRIRTALCCMWRTT